MPELVNLLDDLPPPQRDEVMQVLLARPGVRIERIVSHGQASPPGFWYDQPQGEWVLLLQGAVRLRLEEEPLALRPGSFVHLPPHRRHRIEWTDPAQTTIWLAVHHEELA